MRDWRLKIAITFIGTVIFAILAAGSLDDDKTNSSSTAPTLRGADAMIDSVSEFDSLIVIDLFEKDAFSEKTYVYEVGNAILKSCKFIHENSPSKYQELLFEASMPTQDQYGNEGRSVVMTISYDGDDIEKINYDNFTAWNMLNLSTDVEFERLGTEAAVEFCKDEDNAKWAHRFCDRVLASELN